MFSLITNVAAQSAQTANKSAERLQAQAMHRLSTGVRVNAAQDDAAG
jgi:flagellin-like hook-associated protein FlgL